MPSAKVTQQTVSYYLSQLYRT